MDLGLDGKRALITGGSRGIGLAIAEALAAEGAAVGLIAAEIQLAATAASPMVAVRRACGSSPASGTVTTPC